MEMQKETDLLEVPLPREVRLLLLAFPPQPEDLAATDIGDITLRD